MMRVTKCHQVLLQEFRIVIISKLNKKIKKQMFLNLFSMTNPVQVQFEH